MKIINKDILTVESGIIFHQVNCQGIMGGGLAKALARKFPKLEKAYKDYIQECIGDCPNTDGMLGDVFLYEVPEHVGGLCKVPPGTLFIANIFGQDNISRSRRMTSYDATIMAFEDIQKRDVIKDRELYFPYQMGCGLGGGNWNIYSAIIAEYFPDAIICQKT